MLLNSRGPSDELCLRLAKTVIEGGFEAALLKVKPFTGFLPTKTTCPQCWGKRGKVWDLGRAEGLLSDMRKLAQEIKRGRLCIGCLAQLSDVSQVRGQLKELGKGDPRSLSTRSSGWVRTFLLLVAASIIVSLLSSLPGIFLLLLRLMVNLPTIMFRY